VSAERIDSPDGLPVVYAARREQWREWLAENHEIERGAWLVLYKRDSGAQCVAYAEAVEEALAFGWIDSRAKGVDGVRRIQRFSPRRAKSVWSSSNRRRVERLLAEGRMAPAGLAVVDAAKRSGAWDALAGDGPHTARSERPDPAE
jgi:uncharacterized protein YdeI (YjbR/CyaY-like superfamily)